MVPPLEGYWWQEGIQGFDYRRKDAFHWISVIRLPDFVTEADFAWAIEEGVAQRWGNYLDSKHAAIKN